MPKLDLAAAAAARREVTKDDPPTVTFPDGEEVTLAPEPSIDCAATLMALASLDEDDEDDALRSIDLMVQLGKDILGPTLYEKFLASGATLLDLIDLGAGFMTLYPLGTLGESPASDDSSSKTSSRSRRTSKGSTASTSA